MNSPTWALGVNTPHLPNPQPHTASPSLTTPPVHQLTAFNHTQSNDAEAEYDRLRDLARQEASKRGNCFQRVRRPLSTLSATQSTQSPTLQ